MVNIFLFETKQIIWDEGCSAAHLSFLSVLDKWKALANVKESSLRLGYFHDAQAGSEIGVLFIALYQLPKGWVESIPSRFPKWWSIIYIYIYTGWWFLTILKNMKVSWDDYPIYDGKIKFMFQTTNQIIIYMIYIYIYIFTIFNG